MQRISVTLNVILILILSGLSYLYFDSSNRYELQVRELEVVVADLKAKIATIQAKQYDIFGRIKPTFKEDSLFSAQYVPPNECLGSDDTAVWAKCVDIRREALHEWVIEYRKNL